MFYPVYTIWAGAFCDGNESVLDLVGWGRVNRAASWQPKSPGELRSVRSGLGAADFHCCAGWGRDVFRVTLAERFFLAGLALVGGLVMGWLLRSLRRSSPDTRLEEELRQQVASRTAELTAVRQHLAEATAARAGSEASRAAVEQVATARAQSLAKLEAQLAELRERLATEGAALATARAEIGKGTALLAEQRRFQADNERELREKQDAAVRELRHASEQALAALREQFKAIAADALAANNPEFLRLASARFAQLQTHSEGELARRQESVAALVKPLAEQLAAYQQRLQQAEAAQQNALGQVREHLSALVQRSDTLSGETQRLRAVLSSNQARGRWGEETLRRVVEAAGLSAHCDFEPQVQDADKRPDLLIRLPGERVILIDAKVPDLDFLGALASSDETKRSEALAAHARKLRETIKALAERDYPRRFPQALDHVVLFVPAESLFSAALEGDRDLLLWAADRRILLATPASLIALLRTVSVSWQQHEQSVNAREIAAAAQVLFERIQKFTEHFGEIREHLLKAGAAYDRSVGSYERLVRPAGERLVRLGGAGAARGLEEIPPLESQLRLPSARP